MLGAPLKGRGELRAQQRRTRTHTTAQPAERYATSGRSPLTDNAANAAATA